MVTKKRLSFSSCQIISHAFLSFGLSFHWFNWFGTFNGFHFSDFYFEIWCACQIEIHFLFSDCVGKSFFILVCWEIFSPFHLELRLSLVFDLLFTVSLFAFSRFPDPWFVRLLCLELAFHFLSIWAHTHTHTPFFLFLFAIVHHLNSPQKKDRFADFSIFHN